MSAWPLTSRSTELETANDLLREHFRKFPRQHLRGKVISRSSDINAGEAWLSLEVPGSLRFQYTGAESFESVYNDGALTVRRYPAGLQNAPEQSHFTQLDGLLASTFARLAQGALERPEVLPLFSSVFKWTYVYKQRHHQIDVETQLPFSTLKSLHVDMDDELKLRRLSLQISGENAAAHDFYVVEATYPSSFPPHTFK